MIQSPQQRPDLYDDFDGTNRKPGEPTGVRTPDYLQKLINQRGGAQRQQDVGSKGKP